VRSGRVGFGASQPELRKLGREMTPAAWQSALGRRDLRSTGVTVPSTDFEPLAFSPDRPTIALPGSAGVQSVSGILWGDFDQPTHEVCNLAGDALSRSEWAQYALGIPYQQTCG
jgi:hypothetical protein